MTAPTSPPMAAPLAATIESATAFLIPASDHPTTLREVIEACLHEGLRVIVIDDNETTSHSTMLADLDVDRISLPHRSNRTAAIRAGAALAHERGFTAAITLAAGCSSRAASDTGSLLRATKNRWPAIIVGEALPDRAGMNGSWWIGKLMNDLCLRLESGRNLPGTHSICRLYPLDFLNGKFLSESDGFETEALVRAAWSGLPVIATPANAPAVPPCGGFISRMRRCALHAWLITLSLLPWRARPQPPTGQNETTATSPLLHPVQFFRQLCVEHSSPLELAAAAWVGIFIGALPIIPFGIAAIVYVCHRLHLNKLAGAGASNVCVAPFVPFLCIQVGQFMRHGAWWTTFTRHALVNEIHLRLWEWLLGALIVGPILATLGGFLTYALIVRLRKDQR